MNERVKQVRKSLGLSQEKFGARLGLTQGAIADIERGKAAVTLRNAKTICQLFHVSPEWLETGRGEMWQVRSETFLDQLAEENKLDDRTKRFIGSIIEMSPDVRGHIIDFCLQIADSFKAKDNEPKGKMQMAPSS